jgi:hypothetical protein
MMLRKLTSAYGGDYESRSRRRSEEWCHISSATRMVAAMMMKKNGRRQ